MGCVVTQVNILKQDTKTKRKGEDTDSGYSDVDDTMAVRNSGAKWLISWPLPEIVQYEMPQCLQVVLAVLHL